MSGSCRTEMNGVFHPIVSLFHHPPPILLPPPSTTTITTPLYPLRISGKDSQWFVLLQTRRYRVARTRTLHTRSLTPLWLCEHSLALLFLKRALFSSFTRRFYLFWEPNCDGSTWSGMWLFDSGVPSTSATSGQTPPHTHSPTGSHAQV